MSTYIKISYKTKSTNQALLKCIMYIGKYYGKNDADLLKSGITYLSKKIGNASKRSIKFMIYSDNIKNSKMRQWRFKKNSYEQVYRYIIDRLINKNIGKRDEAVILLHDLYLENNSDHSIDKVFSDILVLEQKDLLSWSIDKPQYLNNQKNIERILKTFDECDIKYSKNLIK